MINKFVHSLEVVWGTLAWVSLEAAVLIVVILIVQRLFHRKLSPAWCCGLWYFLLIKLALPILPTSPASMFNLTRPIAEVVRPGPTPIEVPKFELPNPLAVPIGYPTGVASGVDAVNSKQSTKEMLVSAMVSSKKLSEKTPWWSFLSFVWLLGFTVLGGWYVGASLRFRRILRDAKKINDPPVVGIMQQCAEQFGFQRTPKILETDAVLSPAICGMFHPLVLLPVGMLRGFSHNELRYVFLHELGHIRRHDLTTQWAMCALQALYWFNPAIWFAFRRARADREIATDALALSVSGESEKTQYGEAILKLLQRLARPVGIPGAIGIAEDLNLLKRRIRSIANFRKAPRWSMVALLLTFLLGLVTLTNAVPQTKDGVIDGGSSARELPRMTIRVLSESSDSPIHNAQLKANYFFAGGQMEGHFISTDTNGIAYVPNAKSSERVSGMNLFVNARNYVPLVTSWHPRETIPTNYEYRLKPALMVGGTVKDEAGNAVPNIKVNIQRLGISENDPMNRVDFHPQLSAAYSNSTGQWELPYLPNGMTNFWLTFYATNYMVTKVNVELLNDLEQAVRINGYQKINLLGTDGLDDLDVTIYHGYTLTGSVLALNGTNGFKPVPGATLREVHNWGYPEKEVIADEKGVFKFVGLKDQATIIVADAVGYAPLAESVTLQIGPNSATFIVQEGKSLKGRVVDSFGSPIENAVVRTDTDHHGIRMFDWTTRTDINGHFTYTNAPSGEVLYWFAADGFLPKRGVRLESGTENINIVLERLD